MLGTRARYKWCMCGEVISKLDQGEKKALKSPAASNLSTVNFVCLTSGHSRIIFIVIIIRATLSLVRETSYTFRSENSLYTIIKNVVILDDLQSIIILRRKSRLLLVFIALFLLLLAIVIKK